MFKRITILMVVLLLAGTQEVLAQMSDTQVIEYITQGVAAGKTERQIGNELLSKGVSTAQLQQLLRTYRNSGAGLSESSGAASKVDAAYVGRKSEIASPEGQAVGREGSSSQGKAKRTRKGRPDPAALERREILDLYDPLYDEDGYKRIYGLDVFSSDRLSFEPNQNLATPENYVLGPGDELIIDVWGANEVTIKQKISAEGTITLTQIGPVNLSGLTIKEAKGKLKSVLSKTYSTLNSGSSRIAVSLG
ncbi:MAG: polysaccharide biosynthesis/export family protein, partial [Bacteroidales bacterium]|nr:polysaccharide biosynthesis/export family protein [Bacteroidales bacterium]